MSVSQSTYLRRFCLFRTSRTRNIYIDINI
nr:MAG TPA: hypothetical protein [Caudoviricetes sp.]